MKIQNLSNQTSFAKDYSYHNKSFTSNKSYDAHPFTTSQTSKRQLLDILKFIFVGQLKKISQEIKVRQNNSIPKEIKFKSGVSPDDLMPEMKFVLSKVVDVWKENTNVQPVVTSTNDGKHRNDSLHYENLAIDLRANNLNLKVARGIEAELKQDLGDDYDVIFE